MRVGGRWREEAHESGKREEANELPPPHLPVLVAAPGLAQNGEFFFKERPIWVVLLVPLRAHGHFNRVKRVPVERKAVEQLQLGVGLLAVGNKHLLHFLEGAVGVDLEVERKRKEGKRKKNNGWAFAKKPSREFQI